MMITYLSLLEGEATKEKFEVLYETYRSWMWVLANSILRDEYLAEDAVHDAFLAIARHMDVIDDPRDSSTKSFLATVVKNKALDIIRKKSRREQCVEELPEVPGPDLLDRYLERCGLEEIVQAVSKLDDNYRIVFEYKYLHHCTESEIADLLGISRKLVNVRMFRARKKLQQILKEGGERG